MPTAITTAPRRADAFPHVRRSKAASAITPPSPSLSARRMNVTYFSDTTTVIDQKTSEMTP